MKSALSTVLVFGSALFCAGEEKEKSKPVELEVLKASVGVWDADIEVWPKGPDAPAIRFKGVETNRAYGEHWIASDFDSTFMGQTMKVHSIVGYDPDRKKLVGTIIDHGPYAAGMTGDYDKKTSTVRWTVAAKGADGKPMLQKSIITHKSPGERILVLLVAGKAKGEFVKFMRIRFTRRKKDQP